MPHQLSASSNQYEWEIQSRIEKLGDAISILVRAMFSVVMVLMHYGPMCVHGSVMHMVATQSEGHSGPKIGRIQSEGLSGPKIERMVWCCCTMAPCGCMRVHRTGWRHSLRVIVA